MLNYCGDEAYDVLNIRTEDLRFVLQHMARDGKVKDTEGELPAGIGGHFGFALGGDKPWLLTVIGRRNMNHTYFSPWCKCSRENITCLSCEGGQDGHYSVDQDQMCRDSHVCPNMCLRGGEFVPFTCGCCGKVFACVEDIEVEEDSMLSLEPDVFKARGKVFSLNHDGRFWNAPPLLPFKWVWPDPLHLFLNLFNVAFDESIDFYLQHEFVTDKALINQCDVIAGEINATLARAHITARFGTDERKAFCGNDLRALMEHADVLPEILRLARPLYKRIEPFSFAGDAAKARKKKLKQEERAEKAAAEAASGKPKARAGQVSRCRRLQSGGRYHQGGRSSRQEATGGAAGCR